MSPHPQTPRDPQLAETLRILCGVAAGDAWPASAPAAISHPALPVLAHHHGLDAALFTTDRPLPTWLPPGVRAEWRRARLLQCARNLRAEAQLAELAAGFGDQGIAVAALKGLAAARWLYPATEERQIMDLDLLIREEDVERARAAMTALGYYAEPAYTSPEEELLGVRHVHLSPYTRPGDLPVELHVNLLERRGSLGAAEEAWSGAAWESLGQSPVARLSWEHFVLHTAAHYTRHLDEDFPALKGVVDLLRLMRRADITLDWDRIWSAAGRWGIRDDVVRVLRALRQYWSVAAPGLPDGAGDISLEALAFGLERPRAAFAEAGWDRLSAARELPGFGARVRYVFRLAVPTAAHVRWRYRVPEGHALGPYYARHAWAIVRRMIRSLATRSRRGG